MAGEGHQVDMWATKLRYMSLSNVAVALPKLTMFWSLLAAAGKQHSSKAGIAGAGAGQSAPPSPTQVTNHAATAEAASPGLPCVRGTVRETSLPHVSDTSHFWESTSHL